MQGRRATDEELNRILKTVDLDGYGNRKPNELSGGQKQRVAIARALVKNPEIIMADEPTGALDSATGRQVLDTLKKLSAEKLVIIVSHDREYAEMYADRIIELADGKVIRDVENVLTDEIPAETEKKIRFRQTSIEIPPDYHLTEEDRIQINEYLDKLRSGASIMLPSQTRKFRETDASAIPVQDGSQFSLIKSRLPMNCAFKIGCSSLKYKKFRLVMTILLSVVAFTLFSLVDTFSAYDKINACTDSIIDSGLDYLSISRSVRHDNGDEDEDERYSYSQRGQHFTDENIADISKELGIHMTGIFKPRTSLSVDSQYDREYKFNDNGGEDLHMSTFGGFAEVDAQMLKDMQYEMAAGRLPEDGKNEIAISAAFCDTFIKAGYLAPEKADFDEYPIESKYADMINAHNPEAAIAGEQTKTLDEEKEKPEYEKIASAKDMIGKTLRLMDTDFTVTGVVDTKFDLSHFELLTKSRYDMVESEQIVAYILRMEYEAACEGSLSGCAMVGKGIIDKLAKAQPQFYDTTGTEFTINSNSDAETYISLYCSRLTKAELLHEGDVLWADSAKTTLADNEVIIPFEDLQIYNNENGNEASFIRDILGDTGSARWNITPEQAKALLKKINEFPMQLEIYGTFGSGRDIESTVTVQSGELKIVGLFDPKKGYNNTIALSPSLFEKYLSGTEGNYDIAIGAMPESRSAVQDVVEYCYKAGVEYPEYYYEINSPETEELNTLDAGFKMLTKVFFWIGVGFAVFASLLMANFITTSISYKRQEIGILRAIGSRSADVFRIFFSESFVIAMINFLFSCGGCIAAVTLFNYVLRTEVGVIVTVLHFGLRQALLLVIISVAVAAIASFLPVWHIASKKPIDAIRNK